MAKSDCPENAQQPSLHPGPDISTPAAASLAALQPPQIRPLLAELAGAHLIVEHVPGRYTFHDLLRAYATERAHACETGPDRHAASGRILDHYLRTAYAASLLLNPTREPIALTAARPEVALDQPTDHTQALAWFAAERPVLLAAVAHAAAAGFDTQTWQLAWTLADFLDRRGHWHDWATTQVAAVAAARRLADPCAHARASRLLARAYVRLGQLGNAHTELRCALDLYGCTADHVGQAYTHLKLGEVWARQRRYGEALDHARQALDLFRAAGHQAGQADALNAVGWCHAQLGDHQNALSSCRHALDLLQKLANRLGQASTWDSLGYAHYRLGHHDRAVTCYQYALDLFRDLGDRYEGAATLANLGDAYKAADNADAARRAWQQALNILDDLDHADTDEVRAKLNSI